MGSTDPLSIENASLPEGPVVPVRSVVSISPLPGNCGGAGSTGRTPAAMASRLSSVFSCAVVAALFFNQRHCEKGLHKARAVLFHASSSTTKNTFHLLCIERRGEQGRVFILDFLRKLWTCCARSL